jgi:hypothetical protein
MRIHMAATAPTSSLRPLNVISLTDSHLLYKAGFRAIYIVGFADDGEAAPVKVGIANVIHQRLHGLQTSNWRKIGVHEILFMNTDGPIALRSEQTIHAELRRQGHHVSGEWFAGGAEFVIATAKRVITETIGEEYETCTSMRRKLKMWSIEAEEMAHSAIKRATSRQQTYARSVLDSAMLGQSLVRRR